MITRRRFLHALGIGAAAVAAPAILECTQSEPSELEPTIDLLDWSGYTTAAQPAWNAPSGGDILADIREAQETIKRWDKERDERLRSLSKFHGPGDVYNVPFRPFVPVSVGYADGDGTLIVVV